MLVLFASKQLLGVRLWVSRIRFTDMIVVVIVILFSFFFLLLLLVVRGASPISSAMAVVVLLHCFSMLTTFLLDPGVGNASDSGSFKVYLTASFHVGFQFLPFLFLSP